MRNTTRNITAGLMLMLSFSTLAGAEVKLNVSGAVSSPSPQPSDKTQPPDCSHPNADPRCRAQPAPEYRRYPYRPRPVIINQLPPEPAIEISSLKDDWEGCRTAKLGAIHARNSGSSDQANNLDEWLWKNCRSYSNELRQLEQDDM
ncbi:MAG TPA: hypothetical protein VGK97_13950 [Spongiibacteraceae bacterium]